jgi:hypothetical protein
MRTFKATVNTGIYLFKKNIIASEVKQSHQPGNKDDFIIAADLHNLDIKNGDLEAAFDLIIDIEPDKKCEDGYTVTSDEEMAVYAYRQKIIGHFSNLTFFIASPKLFKLMQDIGNLNPKAITDEKGVAVMFDVKKQKNLFEQDGPNIYQIELNGEKIELVKLGDIAHIVKGMDSKIEYVFRANKNVPIIRTHYEVVDIKRIVDDKTILNFSEEQKLNGLNNKNGISIIPFNKGGSSDVENGWLPNYYVPIEYYIDWSKKAVKKHYHRNKTYYFLDGLTFSFRGEYAPTFRVKNVGPFDANSSYIYINSYSKQIQLAIFCSKLIKFIFTCFIEHTVASDVDSLKKIPLIFNIPENYKQKLSQLVSAIIAYQKQKPHYDYMIKEQVEIDKVIYEMYNLNEEDIKEVEYWYFRRYRKLAKVIEEKLKGKENA